jgi:MFS family permease
MNAAKTQSSEPELTHAEMAKARRQIIHEGVASQSMESFTTGIFLVGIALHFNASNLIIGVLGAIPFLSNLFQIPAIHWVEKSRDRRRIVVISSLIARSFLLVIAFTPLIQSDDIALALIIAGMAIRYSIGAMSSCAWNSWVRDLMPRERAGEFIGSRLFYRASAATLLTIVAAVFIDWWDGAFPNNQAYSYSFLFFMGYVAGMISTYMIQKIPHPQMAAPEAKDYDKSVRFAYLKKPLAHKNFRELLIFLCIWNFAINLAAPFFVVYMLKTLGYDMVFVIIITLISQVMHTFTLKIWGKYSDLYSNKTVLKISGTIFVFCILGWTFTTYPEKHALTTPLLVLLHILMGISTAGVTLSSGNIALKLAPRSEATSFLAVKSIFISLAAGIAPLVGGIFADFFEDKTLSIDLNWHSGEDNILFQTLSIQHWDFFFLLAFVIGLYSLRRLAFVQEDGVVKHKVAVRAMMLDTTRALKGISSVAGLRDACLYPMKMMVNRKKD